MSYILDALNKAEKERQLGSVPTLDSQHQNLFEEKPKRRLIIIVGAILLLNLAFIIYYFYPQDQSASLANTTIDSADNFADSSSHSAPPPPALSVPAQKNIAPVNIAPANTSVANPAPENIAPENIAPKNQTPEDFVATTQAIEQTNIDKHVASKTVIETSNKNTTNIESNYEQIPFLAEKSASFQQTIPDLKIDVHVYSETPANRFVLINLKRYQEDDHIAKGLLIEAITEEGLILSFNQEKFRFLMLIN